MKTFVRVVVCFSLVQLLAAGDASETESLKVDANDVIISKILEELHSVKSSQCKGDLNHTVNAFLERKPWAIASKNGFRARTLVSGDIVRSAATFRRLKYGIIERQRHGYSLVNKFIC